MTHIQIAPNVEFKMDIDIPGITDNPRDYDLQQHKAEIYAEFEDRLVQWIKIMEGTNDSKREELDRAKVMEARSKFKDEEGEECPISEEEMLKAISEMRDNLFPKEEK